MFQTILQLTQSAFSIHPDTPGKEDVHIEGAKCTIDPAQLKAIRKRAARLLWSAAEKGFGQFPVDRQKLIRSAIGRFLKEDAICAVLTTGSGATKSDHNNLREGFQQTTISPEDAAMRGLATAMLPLEPSCPKDYDWTGSEVYNGISSCDDVVKLINRDKETPAMMFASNMKAGEVERSLNDPATAPIYMRYAKDGLKQCKGEEGFADSFHVLKISKILGNLEFAMRVYHGNNWSAWTLLKGCEDGKGRRYEAADMALDFGLRVYTPINVNVDGQMEERTLVIGMIAAASSHALASLLPASMTSRRWFAGELAKKIFLEAKENGWEITTF